MPIEYEALKQHLQPFLGASTTPNSKSSSGCNNSVTTQDWARQSRADGKWNKSLLQVTKKMVQDGKSDEEIHMCTDELTTRSYTVEQTRKQIQPMIDGARAKFGEEEKRNTANVFTMLTEDARWASVFAFDELSNRTMVIAKPPFVTGDPKHFKSRAIKDSDYTKVQMWIQLKWGHVNKNVVIDAVNAACEEQIISPVRHYLESLPASKLR